MMQLSNYDGDNNFNNNPSFLMRKSSHLYTENASLKAWRGAMQHRERLFSLYLECFSSKNDLSHQYREMLDNVFPNEAELNVL